MRRWIFWIGILISAVLLYLALGNLQLNDFWQTIKTAHFIWIIPGIVVYFMGVYARAWRWHYLLRPIKKVPTNTMFPIVTIGYMGNNIYGYRIGEVLRAIILKRHADVPISASLATIIVERIFDGVVMLAFIFVNLPELATITHNSGYIGNIRTVAIYGSALFFGALLIFLVAAMVPQVTGRIIDWLVLHLLPVRFREKTGGIAHKFLDGLESLRSPKDVLMVFVTSVIIWLFETGKYWFVMHAFDFQVSFFALMLMNGIVNLATTLPSAPGYLGTFDAPGIAVLEAYNVPQNIATGYTLVLHAALWLPITLLGAYYFFVQEGMSWSSFSKARQEEDTENNAI
jgi:glycosyltransferase 2 family protein